MPHPFEQALTLTGEPSHRIATVSDAYQNMVGPFGGVTAALLLQAVLKHPDCQGAPIALTVNFLAPIKHPTMDIYPVLLRTNRSNQHWQVHLKQGDDILCSATCVLATRQSTWYSQPLSCPQAPPPEQVEPLPPISQVAWLNRYDMRFIYGNPLSGAESENAQVKVNESESLLWLSDNPPRTLDFASLTALSDAFLPRLFVSRRQIAPIGTVTFTVYFHVTEEELNAVSSPRVLGQARASKFAQQYFDQSAELWSAEQTLLATTSQMVYYKA